MSSMVDGSVSAGSLRAAHAEVDALLATDLTRSDADGVLDAWRELERLRNRLAAVEHAFVAEAESRGLPAEFGCRDIAALIRGLLRAAPGDARARVRAADAAAARTTLTGAPAPAPFVEVAAAQAAGTISPRHAQVVVRAVESLPDEVQAVHGTRVESDLVSYAEQFDPLQLGRLATRTTTLLDQDGALADVAYRQRHRDLDLFQRPDGSGTVAIEATAELMERLLCSFDALAKPRPAVDGLRDPRTAGQRRHDALLDLLDLVQRADLLPDAGGISTTVLLTMTGEAWRTGTGVATTGHGAVLPAPEAIRIAGGDHRLMRIAFDALGGVVGWTDARRCYTESQRLAMIARDGGCTFPGCNAPPAWCQAHHIEDHADGGPTTVDNGALVCGCDHRDQIHMGWRAKLIKGRVGWVPPPWIDRDRVPRFNYQWRPG